MCGYDHNLIFKNRAGSELKQFVIENLDSAILCSGTDWATKGVSHVKEVVRLSDFRDRAVGTRAMTDITKSGMSASGKAGGLDVGAAEPDREYCLWIVSDGTAEGTGLVWSKRCHHGGPEGSVSKAKPFYYAYIGWNMTNSSCPGSGCAFRYAFVKKGDWVRFSEESMPVVMQGMQHQWTPTPVRDSPRYRGYVSPTGSVVLFSISNNTAGTHAALAPNIDWGGAPVCDNIGGPPMICGPMGPDRGRYGYWSTSPTAVLRVAGFEDNL
jgi:hypothetical protein